MGKNHRNWKNKNKSNQNSYRDGNSRIQRPSKNVYLQFICSGIEEHSPCMFLFTDSKRYIFNCMEGSQRLFTQNRIKIGKLDTFFFTRHQWSHIGGFPGFAMTLRDAKSSANESLKQQKRFSQQKMMNVNVYGPQGTKEMLGAAHSFMRFEKSGMRLDTHEFGAASHGKLYEDFELSVHSIPIYGSVPPVSVSGMSLSQHRLLEPLMPSMTNSPPSLCFAVHLKPLPGRFDAKKAKELGISPGPMYTELQMGKDITLNDGTVITKSDVIDPDIPGTYFLIVDCPSASYIDSLSTNNAIQKYMCQGDQQVSSIIHLGSKAVCSEPKYSQWMKRFQPDTKHLFTNNIPYNTPVFRGQHSLQSMLNVIDNNIFPLIEPNVQTHCPRPTDNDLQLYNLTKLQLRDIGNSTRELFDHSLCFKKHNIKELRNIAKSLVSLQKCKTDTSETSEKSDTENASNKSITDLKGNGRKRTLTDTGDSNPSKKPLLDNKLEKKSYPQVLFLGTGAAIPSKYRNVSATLLFFSETNAVLLDCGEDTYGQLFRHYGNRVDGVLKKIKMILISHMHADHHLGLFTLLNRIKKLEPDRNVVIAAPYYYRQWFLSYTERCEVLNCQFVSCKNILSGSWLTKEIFVKSIKVDHPADAHGFLVKDKKHSVVYSGDTKPCDRLIEEGKNCTLLIHEATLEDEMFEEALARKHSTTSQSLEVAQKMKAKNLIMTHFSQRYPRIPKLKNTPIASHTAIAFDHMELSIDDIPKFQDYVPIIQKLLVKEEEDNIEDQNLEGGGNSMSDKKDINVEHCVKDAANSNDKQDTDGSKLDGSKSDTDTTLQKKEKLENVVEKTEE